jgi:hypothetical protein
MSSAHNRIPAQTGTFLPVLVTMPGDKGTSVSDWLKKIGFIPVLKFECFEDGDNWYKAARMHGAINKNITL